MKHILIIIKHLKTINRLNAAFSKTKQSMIIWYITGMNRSQGNRLNRLNPLKSRFPEAKNVRTELGSIMIMFISKTNRLFIGIGFVRSEEHTSELQSRFDLVCRLL